MPPLIWSYVEKQDLKKKNIWDWQAGVILVSSGLNRGILLQYPTFKILKERW